MDTNEKLEELSNKLDQTLPLLNSLEKKLNAPVKKKRFDQLAPAIIGGLVAILTTTAALTFNYFSDLRREEASNVQSAINIANFKFQIINSIDKYDLPTASILMSYVLRPIDKSEDTDSFRVSVLDLIAERAVRDEPGASSLTQETLEFNVIDSDFRRAEISELLEKFRGPERLIASNRLIELYPTEKEAVVKNLVDSLLPGRSKESYRVNIYIVFTLGRIYPNWEGTPDQIRKITELRNTSNYLTDDTFRKRTEEAISNALEL